MWSTWAMAGPAAFADISVDGGRTDSGGVREVNGVGAFCADAGAVCAEYATALSAVVSQSSD